MTYHSRLHHHKIIEQHVHTGLGEGASQQAHISAREIRILCAGDQVVVDVERQRISDAIGAEMVEGIYLNDLGGLHFALTEQGGLASDEFADGIEAIVRDDEEIIIAVLVAAHHAGAILLGPVEFCHIRFDARIAQIHFRRGPEIHLRLEDQHTVSALIVIHDAHVIGEAIPSAGVVLEFILQEDGAGRRQRGYGGWRGSARAEKKEERRKEKKEFFHERDFIMMSYGESCFNRSSA